MTDEPRDDAELLKRARAAALATAVQQLRLIHELKQRSPLAQSGQAAPYALPPSVQSEASDLLFDVTRLSLLNYEQWLKLSGKHFDFIADTLVRLGRHAPSPAQLSLKAAAKPGERATARLVIENPLAQRAQVSFTVPVLRQEAGGLVLPAMVSCERIDDQGRAVAGYNELEPRQSARFQFVVVPDQRAGAGCYRGEANVCAGAKVVGRLSLEVEVLQ
ncbi:MAG: hypothetical protein HY699_12120 [Deltaproteobacteria bacterium]|nr:hypothetical protein [Deltaproteobacteria bacterium]